MNICNIYCISKNQSFNEKNKFPGFYHSFVSCEHEKNKPLTNTKPQKHVSIKDSTHTKTENKEIVIEKDFLYTEHDTYPYKDTVRVFQWEK